MAAAKPEVRPEIWALNGFLMVFFPATPATQCGIRRYAAAEVVALAVRAPSGGVKPS